jgi:SagB-type dehydrogenase family enzyme
MKRRTMMARTLLTVGASQALAKLPLSATTDVPDLILLPRATGSAGQTLEQALVRRRSTRSYAPQPVSMPALSQVLWAAQGITASGGRRTAPSAGALYPLELHVVAARVEGLAPGVYRYVAHSHGLRPVAVSDILPALARAALSQQSVQDAAVAVVIAAVEQRTTRKYSPRAGRYVAFEAGAASQNLALQAAALGLGTVVIGAFDDGAVAGVLRLGPGERPVALMPIGIPG